MGETTRRSCPRPPSPTNPQTTTGDIVAHPELSAKVSLQSD